MNKQHRKELRGVMEGGSSLPTQAIYNGANSKIFASAQSKPNIKMMLGKMIQ